MQDNNIHFLDALLNDIENNVELYTVDAYGKLVAIIWPPLVALVGLYIVVQGIRLYLGQGDHSPTSYMRQTFIIVMITILATNWDWFAALIVNTVTKAPEVLIQALITNDAGSEDGTTGFFTEFFDNSVEVFIKIFKEGGWTNIAPLFIGGVGMLAAVILVAAVFMLLVAAKVLISVLLVLAPLIIPTYLFMASRNICLSWSRLLISTMFVPILVYAVSGLFMSILKTQLEGIQAEDVDIYKVLAYLVTVIICLLLMTQIPSLATGIGGEVIYASAGFRGSKYARNQ
jgi:type IV secretion system protein VirB6